MQMLEMAHRSSRGNQLIASSSSASDNSSRRSSRRIPPASERPTQWMKTYWTSLRCRLQNPCRLNSILSRSGRTRLHGGNVPSSARFMAIFMSLFVERLLLFLGRYWSSALELGRHRNYSHLCNNRLNRSVLAQSSMRPWRDLMPLST
jgi:hypothetical protein